MKNLKLTNFRILCRTWWNIDITNVQIKWETFLKCRCTYLCFLWTIIKYFSLDYITLLTRDPHDSLTKFKEMPKFVPLSLECPPIVLHIGNFREWIHPSNPMEQNHHGANGSIQETILIKQQSTSTVTPTGRISMRWNDKSLRNISTLVAKCNSRRWPI